MLPVSSRSHRQCRWHACCAFDQGIPNQGRTLEGKDRCTRLRESRVQNFVSDTEWFASLPVRVRVWRHTARWCSWLDIPRSTSSGRVTLAHLQWSNLTKNSYARPPKMMREQLHGYTHRVVPSSSWAAEHKYFFSQIVSLQIWYLH